MVGLLLLAGIALELMAGGLQAFQTAALTMALPFCLVLLVMCVSLLKAFSQERP
jgi:choline-glycine betaine transporter